jgi:hypothetical protein
MQKQLGGRADFYILLFAVMYMAWSDKGTALNFVKISEQYDADPGND